MSKVEDRFAFGSEHWPGLSKLNEECGEVVQVIGKFLGTRGKEQHWDGTNLRERMIEEMGDVLAAIGFVCKYENLTEAVKVRASEKSELFEQWHVEKDPV